MSAELVARIAEILPTVSYAVGYSIEDETSQGYMTSILSAGMEDMLTSGVLESVLLASPLVVSALIIFANDNMKMGEEFKTSPIYIAIVDKLR